MVPWPESFMPPLMVVDNYIRLRSWYRSTVTEFGNAMIVNECY
jgi:hypothetical protein